MNPRPASLISRLRRCRVTNPQRAEKWLTSPALAPLISTPDKSEEFFADLEQTADPDQVILALLNLVEPIGTPLSAEEKLLVEQCLFTEASSRRKLMKICGASRYFADYLVGHRADLKVLNCDWASTTLGLLTPDSTDFPAKLSDKQSQLTNTQTQLPDTQTKPADCPNKVAKVPTQAADYPTELLDIPYPDFLEKIRSFLLKTLHAQEVKPRVWVAGMETDSDQLRRAYRQILLWITTIDLSAPDSLAIQPIISNYLTALVEATLEAALALARRKIDPKAETLFTIVAMGKTGAQELNYISDVDVIYVAEDPAHQLKAATKIATALGEICSGPSTEAPLWPLDTTLRPEGKDGAPVRTLASYAEYYQKWAKNWEFQALLKARPVAGDKQLGEEFLNLIQPLVWNAVERPGFVEEAHHLRRRVEKQIPRNQIDRQIKLGPGGLRDVEFSVQLLQLVHGRTDPNLRIRPTLQAIAALVNGGYIGRSAGEELGWSYRFLRTIEHRAQLVRMQRTQVLPTAATEMRNLARSIRLCPELSIFADLDNLKPIFESGEQLEERWQKVRNRIRLLQQDIFYRPLLPATAGLSKDEVALTPQAAQQRLRLLGYRDPRGAIRHIQALTEGLSRRAAIVRHVLPVMLHWLANGADPDAGLRRFRDLSDAVGTEHWFMGLLRDSATVARRLCQVLSTSSYAAERFLHVPTAVQWLDQDQMLHHRTAQQLNQEISALVHRHDNPKTAISRVREVRARELFRTALADVVYGLNIRYCVAAISQINDLTLQAAMKIAQRELAGVYGIPVALLPRLIVVALGRQGGQESGYASDLDLMIVSEDIADYEARLAKTSDTGSDLAATGESITGDIPSQNVGGWSGEIPFTLAEYGKRFAILLRDLLNSPDPAPQVLVDYGLRPEGEDGPLARTLSSYREYYERWGLIWESQALLRARVVAGDPQLGEAFVALVDQYRYPSVLSGKDVKEIRRLKARMEKERIPRGKDPQLQVKLGPGGLSDVEWVVQLLQLKYAAQYPQLRTTRTDLVLIQLAQLGILSQNMVNDLEAAWQLATRIRNGNVLVTNRLQGKKLDFLPGPGQDRKDLAGILGYPLNQEGELEEDYRRAARRCRRIVEEAFYQDLPLLADKMLDEGVSD